MSDQQSQPQNPEPDWRDDRWQQKQDRRETRWGQHGPWIGGVLLIVLGVIFLLQNFGYPIPQNWWAVFILIPAAAAFSGAWSIYQRNNRQVTAAARGALISGVILTALAGAFFFNFDFGKFWPVILILLGVAALSGGVWRRNDRPPG